MRGSIDNNNYFLINGRHSGKLIESEPFYLQFICIFSFFAAFSIEQQGWVALHIFIIIIDYPAEGLGRK